MINLGEAKKITFRILLENDIEDYQYEGLSLLSKILRLDTKTILTENEIVISINQKKAIEKIIKKRIEGIPLAYLTKERLFFNERFCVNNKVLIPRQETEELINYFFSIIEKDDIKNKRILDIGTGSGIIPIICKKKFPEANIFTIDKSIDAINIAKKNAHKKELEINFINSEIIKTNINEIDYVISNPPYIKTEMLSKLSDEVNYEPKLALDGGKDGLSIIRDIFLWEKNTNKNNAKKIVIEIDQNITLEAIDLARYFYPKKRIEIIKDLSERDRIIAITEKFTS